MGGTESVGVIACACTCVHGYNAAAYPCSPTFLPASSHCLPPSPPVSLTFRCFPSLCAHLSACLFTLAAPFVAHHLSLLTHLLAHSPGHLDAKLDAPPLPPAHPPRNLLANHRARTMPNTTGRMGEGTAGKRGVGTGMGTWVSVCVRSWVRERIRSFRSGVRASVRIAADICSGVSVGKHTGGSWRTCQHAYVGRE